MEMFSYQFSPADVERILGIAPETLRDYRRRRTGLKGQSSGKGRFLYSRGDLYQLMLQKELMLISKGVEGPGRCASYWVYGSVVFDTEEPKSEYPRPPMQLFEGERTYLVMGHHSLDTNLTTAVLSESELDAPPSNPFLIHPKSLSARGVPVTIFDLQTFYENATQFLDDKPSETETG